MAPSPADKRQTFRTLHERGCFVIPNPWNPGTACYLQALGFPALATTSSGYAHSQGFSDGEITCEMALTHARELAATADVPVNCDFENGFAHEPEGVAANVRACIDTGVAGLSIEDFTGDKDEPIYDFDLAVRRIRAARDAIDRSGTGVVLTGRAEGILHGRPDLTEIVRRLQAYAEAGADCLYAPGIRTPEQIETVVKAVAPKPVNLLMSSAAGLTVKDVAELGVRRISVGGTLARVAMQAFIASATEIAKEGKFDSFAGVISNAELNQFFSRSGAKKPA